MDKPKDAEHRGSSLRVKRGIESPSVLHPEAADQVRKSRKELLTAKAYTDGILSGDRTILSRAITLVESALPAHHELAQEIIESCLPHSGKSVRVGITGVPGVGKSTFIEALGKLLTGMGYHLAVLAVDPSSRRSKGSILGDKTRMEELASDPNAFIRPSPSAGSLGGVARKTKETIILCEAAGFDVIFVETVGVGQSETAVHSMVDFFLLLMLTGAGDELQGIKRGIMEMADAIIIHKADGDNRQKAIMARKEYENALHLLPPPESGWTPRAGICSSINGEGITEVWEMITEYMSLTRSNGYLESHRMVQDRDILMDTIRQSLSDRFLQDPSVRGNLPGAEEEIRSGRLSAYQAARKLIDLYFTDKK
ncbi:MAG: methylmalonyl Co-A mutase-associated GTPase MeaB [Bacteroidales bacterium]|nr:methylmalonyl Co-A mutase-associated GTPase MeaB [Bacteroidales bacterium]